MAIKITTRIDATNEGYAEIVTHSSNENITLLVYEKDVLVSGIEFTQEQFIDFNKSVSDVYFDKRINELEDILESVPQQIKISIPEDICHPATKERIGELEEEISTWKQVCVNNKETIKRLQDELTLYKNTK